MKEVVKVKSLLNKTKIYGCEEIMCGDALHYPIENYKAGGNNVLAAFIEMLRIIKKTIVVQYEVACKGIPETLFLASTSYGSRKDLCRLLRKVVDYENNYIYMTPAEKKRISLRNVMELAKPAIWNFQLKGIIKEKRLRWHCIRELYSAWSDYIFFKRLCEKEKYSVRNLVCLCDVHCVDSFFTQKFNAIKLTTVTLQHGTMVSFRNTWAYTGSKSKYFFAQGNFSVDEGKIAGYPDTGNMVPVGLISYVGQREAHMPEILSIHTIGVVMNGESGEMCKEKNVAIIQIMNRYRKKYQRKVIFKFHPTSKISDYEEYMDDDMGKYCYSKEISMLEFIGLSDAAVVWSSTGMIEMLKSWKPAFIIRPGETADDIYKNVDLPRFRDEDELELMINEFEGRKSLDRLNRIRDYFCASGDTTENYVIALKRLGIG